MDYLCNFIDLFTVSGKLFTSISLPFSVPCPYFAGFQSFASEFGCDLGLIAGFIPCTWAFRPF